VLVVSREGEIESLFTVCINEKGAFVQVHIPGGIITVPYTAFVEGLSKIHETLKQPVLTKFPADFSIESLWSQKIVNLTAPSRYKWETPPEERVGDSEDERPEETDEEGAEVEENRGKNRDEDGGKERDREEESEKEEKREEKSALLQQIIDFAEKQEGEVSLEQAYEAFKDFSRPSVRSAFSRLQRRGVLERVGKGVYRVKKEERHAGAGQENTRKGAFHPSQMQCPTKMKNGEFWGRTNDIFRQTLP